MALTGSIVFAAILALSVDQEATPVSASDNFQKANPTPALTTATPIPMSTPNVLATRIADTKETLRELTELQRALDVLRSPSPVPAPQPIPQVGGRDIIVVHPDVVKPEVVKPEVVKVPEIVRVEVPIPATPNPDWVSLTRRELNTLTEERAEKIAAEAKQKAEIEVKAAKVAVEAAKRAQAEAEAKAAVTGRGWSFDWWSGLIGGAVGIVVTGLIVRMVRPVRFFVIERLGGTPLPPP